MCIVERPEEQPGAVVERQTIDQIPSICDEEGAIGDQENGELDREEPHSNHLSGQPAIWSVVRRITKSAVAQS